MTYNKEARIAELKAMPREELEALAIRLGIRVIKGFQSPLQLARKIEEREFSDLRIEAEEFKALRRKEVLKHIKEIF